MSSAEASPPSPERGSEVSNSQWDAFPHKPAADTFSEVQTTVPEVVFRTLWHVQRECPGFTGADALRQGRWRTQRQNMNYAGHRNVAAGPPRIPEDPPLTLSEN